jgi:hypothetical protein
LKEESSMKISRGLIFWCLKLVSSAGDDCREKSKAVLESPGDKESD